MNKKNTDQDESNVQTPQEIAESYRHDLFEITRKRIALARKYPPGVVRYKRAARTGPNREWAVIWFLPRGEGKPRVEVMAWDELERIASEIPDQIVEAWYAGFGQSAEDFGTQ
jgi:hypothetical protein